MNICVVSHLFLSVKECTLDYLVEDLIELPRADLRLHSPEADSLLSPEQKSKPSRGPS